MTIKSGKWLTSGGLVMILKRRCLIKIFIYSTPDILHQLLIDKIASLINRSKQNKYPISHKKNLLLLLLVEIQNLSFIVYKDFHMLLEHCPSKSTQYLFPFHSLHNYKWEHTCWRKLHLSLKIL